MNIDEQTIMVPFNHNLKSIRTIKMNGKMSNIVKIVKIIDSKYCLIKVPKGKQSLEIIYD